MRNPRIHVEAALASGGEFALPEVAARHVVQVLRMRVGAALTLFNGDGKDYPAELIAVGRRDATVRIGAPEPVDNESPLRITLLQGISKGERMDWAIQKAVELRVARIVPVITERTVVRVDEARQAKRLAHWRGVVIAACEQCGRATIPEVDEPLDMTEVLTRFDGLVLDPLADTTLLAAARGMTGTALLIGPEGGLSDAEIQAACDQGWQNVALGPRVLRTETAALAALAVLQAGAGDLA